MSKYFDMLAYLMGKQAGGGGGDITVVSKSFSANGTYTAPSGKAYSPVTVYVPNSYAAGDEGKVVSNGELVAQGSDSVTQNGTVDTTLINSLTVNVSGGGGGYQKKSYTFTLASSEFTYGVPIDENISDIVFAHWWDEDAVYTTAGTPYEGSALGPADKKYQAASDAWLIWRTHASNGTTGYTTYGNAFSTAGHVTVASSPALIAGHTYNLDIFIGGAS